MKLKFIFIYETAISFPRVLFPFLSFFLLARKIVGEGFLPDRPEARKTAPGFWARFLELYEREALEANR